MGGERRVMTQEGISQRWFGMDEGGMELSAYPP